jgi:hypothetical protein
MFWVKAAEEMQVSRLKWGSLLKKLGANIKAKDWRLIGG